MENHNANIRKCNELIQHGGLEGTPDVANLLEKFRNDEQAKVDQFRYRTLQAQLVACQQLLAQSQQENAQLRANIQAQESVVAAAEVDDWRRELAGNN